MSDQTTTLEGADEGRAMELYEYIVNHVDECRGQLDNLIMELRRADASGQFLASSARFLAAVDKEGFAEYLPALIEAAIAKDRERAT